MLKAEKYGAAAKPQSEAGPYVCIHHKPSFIPRRLISAQTL